MKLSIVSFDHEDIVNILASTVDGSRFIGVRYNESVWEELPEDQKTEDPCIEDICADLLLAGKSIYLLDVYSEENDFEEISEIRKGELVCEYCGPLYGDVDVMRYEVNLKDFVAAANSKNGNGFIMDFINENDDLYTSEGFLQVVMFGEVVYG